MVDKMKYIELHRYKGKNNLYTIVDDDNFYEINKYKWHISSLGYVIRTEKNKIIYLHRKIMNFPLDKVIDHINGNKIDNRKSNLRIVSIKKNVRNQKYHKNNTSGFLGVSFRKGRNRYRATITVDKKQIFLGNFINIKDAIDARNKAVKKYFL